MHPFPAHRTTTTRTRRDIPSWLAAVIALLASASQPALAFNVYKVGGDAACPYGTIQDAVAAAAANPGVDYVWIANNKTYTKQRVVVANQDVIIEGGFASCESVDVDSTPTAIDGPNNDSAFIVAGNSNVQLGYLEISGGSGDFGYGGGVFFEGNGSLVIDHAWLHGNVADYGGGLAIVPTGSAVVQVHNSTLSLNHATNRGGAIYVGPNTTFFSDSHTYITHNDTGTGAAGSGGGIYVAGGATASVSSNLNNNVSDYGGGIAASLNDAPTRINLYTTDAGAAATLYANVATQNGGGLYLDASSQPVTLCAQDFAIDANSAQNGAAFMATGPLADVHLNDASFGDCAPGDAPVPPVACTAAPFCNEIADNVSQQSDATPTGGSTLVLGAFGSQSAGNLHAARFAARRNHAGALLYVNDENAPASGDHIASMSDCLIADNVNAYYDIWAHGGATGTLLTLQNCTLAHDGGTLAAAIRAEVDLVTIAGSIVDESVPVLDATGLGSLVAQYDLLGDGAGFSSGTGITVGRPTFVDAANADYHLQRTSPGVDYAPAGSGIDLDGHPRVVDLADVANVHGPMDLGAYEIPGAACGRDDTVYCNGFDPP